MTRVFVANLNFDTVDDSALFELFSRFIDVRFAKLARDAAGQSRGFGFVELINDVDLDAALELDGYLFHDRTIRVQLARDKNEWARIRLTTS